jgi:DNA primase
MSFSRDTPRDNLTLSESDLAACRPIVGEGGHVVRALCPFHGSDRQRSLRVQVHSGRFVCFACGAWGYMDTARAQWHEERQRQAAFPRPPARRQQGPRQRQSPSPGARPSAPRPPVLREPTPARADLSQQLTAFQSALPGSRGAAYLQQRGIPLGLAQQLGVGYAAPGRWPPAANASQQPAPAAPAWRRPRRPPAGGSWVPGSRRGCEGGTAARAGTESNAMRAA